MSRVLLIVGGVLNSILAVFHMFLGYRIYQIQDVAAPYRALMIMLNAGGTLFILLFAVASLAFATEMLATRLGKLLMLFIVLLYASRAVEEVTVAPHFSAVIFAVCLLIAAIYLVLLFHPRQTPVISEEKPRI